MVLVPQAPLEYDRNLPRFGPKQPGHPSVGEQCPACHRPFVAGDYTTLVELGPGDDPEQRAKASAGGVYTAVALEVHYACATGDES